MGDQIVVQYAQLRSMLDDWENALLSAISDLPTGTPLALATSDQEDIDVLFVVYEAVDHGDALSTGLLANLIAQKYPKVMDVVLCACGKTQSEVTTSDVKVLLDTQATGRVGQSWRCSSTAEYQEKVSVKIKTRVKRRVLENLQIASPQQVIEINSDANKPRRHRRPSSL